MRNKLIILLLFTTLVLSGCSVTSKKKEIVEDSALQIALDHAGVLEKDTVYLRVDRDSDDSDFIFEVKFATDSVEYYYEINPYGKIIEYDKINYTIREEEPNQEKEDGGDVVVDYDDDTDYPIIYSRPTYYYSGPTRYYYSGPTRSGATVYVDPANMISDAQAQEIAFKHAGVPGDQARIIKFKRDDYRYKIDFVYDGYKHQYEINGDGTIIKSKKKLYR